MIDFKFLEKLVDLMARSEAATIEIRKWPWSTSVKVSKYPSEGAPVTYQVGSPVAHAAAPVAAGAQSPAAAATETAEPAVEAQNYHEIKSPMVGTFYAQPEPGSDPYVKAGSRIAPGQTLCIIEAMKIMNPLDAEVSGVLKEVCVEDSQPVEFGQVLFKVDTNG